MRYVKTLYDDSTIEVVDTTTRESHLYWKAKILKDIKDRNFIYGVTVEDNKIVSISSYETYEFCDYNEAEEFCKSNNIEASCIELDGSRVFVMKYNRVLKHCEFRVYTYEMGDSNVYIAEKGYTSNKEEAKVFDKNTAYATANSMNKKGLKLWLVLRTEVDG